MYNVKDLELLKNIMIANVGVRGLKFHCAGYKHPTHPCNYCMERPVEFVTLQLDAAARHSLDNNTPMWISNDADVEKYPDHEMFITFNYHGLQHLIADINKALKQGIPIEYNMDAKGIFRIINGKAEYTMWADNFLSTPPPPPEKE